MVVRCNASLTFGIQLPNDLELILQVLQCFLLPRSSFRQVRRQSSEYHYFVCHYPCALRHSFSYAFFGDFSRRIRLFHHKTFNQGKNYIELCSVNKASLAEKRKVGEANQ